MAGENRTRRYLKGFFGVAAGAGAVLGAAYLYSRIKEKQNAETRLERIEQIIDELSKEGRKKKA
jgi:hypothetical protein